MTALKRLIDNAPFTPANNIEACEAELAALEARSAALTSLLAVILGDDKYEAGVGFEEATRDAISTWNDVAEAARYYDSENEYP